MTFDPLVADSVEQDVKDEERPMDRKVFKTSHDKPKNPVESFLLGPESRWISMLQALTILDHERHCEPPRLKGAHVRRRVVKSAGAGEKRIDIADLRAVLDHQRKFGGHIEHILVNLGLADEEEIVHELTTHYGFPYLPLSHYELDGRVLRVLPLEVARHYCMVPIDRISNILTVAVANPLNSEAIKDVQRLTGCSVLVMVSKASEIRQKIEECHGMFSGPSDRSCEEFDKETP